MTASDLAVLPIDPGEVLLNRTTYTLVQLPTIAYTEADEQVLDTILLDTPVRVRVTPEQYEWDFNDGPGSTLITDDPGARYPDHTFHYEYRHTHPAQTIDLTITWSAEFEVAGDGNWIPVDGTTTTTTTSPEFPVLEATVRLVAPGWEPDPETYLEPSNG